MFTLLAASVDRELDSDLEYIELRNSCTHQTAQTRFEAVHDVHPTAKVAMQNFDIL